MNICAIVLAAGRSVRMGTQKLLLPYGDKTIIAHIVDQVLTSSVKPIVVVVGRNSDKIREALHERDVSFVENPDFKSDMLGSIRCGMGALPKDCDAALIVLGDQPGISRELIASLVQAFKENTNAIVAPVCNGKRGHPLLVSSRFFQELLSKHDGVGLQGLLGANANQVLTVPTNAMLDDMDTPEDYQRLLRTA